jgi:3-hydroxyisobutyrate dehydrogenase
LNIKLKKQKMPVGFIGLGNMGGHMARNLINRGVNLIVHDQNPTILKQFDKSGVKISSTPADLASKCEEIITMLPSGSNVLEVFANKAGILECIIPPDFIINRLFRTMRAGTLCIDCSTIDQSAAIQVSDLVSARKGSFIDAPVSGGVLGLNIICHIFTFYFRLKELRKARYVLWWVAI